MDIPEKLLLLPLWYVVFLLSVTCHEAAHALAAHLGGDDTAYLGGQMTLNPVAHMQRDPVGTMAAPVVTFFLMGWMMGWASAPYDPYWESRHPRRAALMALAGPLANLALFAMAFAVIKIGLGTGTWVHAGAAWSIDRLVVPVGAEAGALEAIARLASITLVLNLVLCLFNLLPLPPLDGSSVLAGLFGPGRRLREWLLQSPMGGIGGLIVAWILFLRLFPPVWFFVQAALYGAL